MIISETHKAKAEGFETTRNLMIGLTAIFIALGIYLAFVPAVGGLAIAFVVAGLVPAYFAISAQQRASSARLSERIWSHSSSN